MTDHDSGLEYVRKLGRASKATFLLNVCWVPDTAEGTHHLLEPSEKPCEVYVTMVTFQMKKLRLREMKGAHQDHRTGEAQACHFAAVHWQPLGRKP